jgi:NAD-dependent dihydropyrimidine dehydrogenase PreA subunit
MFCPMGTMANLLGKGKHSLLVNDSCANCGCCNQVCRMQIKPGTYRPEGVVNYGDCLKCAYCIKVCSQKALSFAQVSHKESGTIGA